MSVKKKKENLEIKNIDFLRIVDSDQQIKYEFKEFLNHLPDGIIYDSFVEFINALDHTECSNLISIFKSKANINELKHVNYSIGIEKKLFELEPKGVGRGEIMMAWMFNDAKINGGSESFDLALGQNKYELKASKTNTGGLRTGKEGALTSKNFYKIIKDTLRRMENLTSNGKFDIKSILTDEEFLAWTAINEDDYNKINDGEISKARIQKLKNFYEVFNKAETDNIQGYSNLILRGPNEIPMELSIDPVSFKDIKPGDTITLKIADPSNDRIYVLTELMRLKYVRIPHALDIDIQEEIDSLTTNKQFIIFRPKGAIVTSNLRLAEITGRTIKVVEA